MNKKDKNNDKFVTRISIETERKILFYATILMLIAWIIQKCMDP
jgi:hypothetical protein